MCLWADSEALKQYMIQPYIFAFERLSSSLSSCKFCKSPRAASTSRRATFLVQLKHLPPTEIYRTKLRNKRVGKHWSCCPRHEQIHIHGGACMQWIYEGVFRGNRSSYRRVHSKCKYATKAQALLSLAGYRPFKLIAKKEI